MVVPTQIRAALIILILLTLAACGSTPRPDPPPAGAPLQDPFGAVPLNLGDENVPSIHTVGMLEAAERKRSELALAGSEEKIPYRALTLSGGGSRGAYGAGVLSGWTARGDRPEFDVVTGISTGALMATHAFLGSDYDHKLEIYKTISNDDVFEQKGRLSAFISAVKSAAGFNTEPLRATLRTVIDEDTLDLVAEEHRQGRRLFVGSTNLDSNAFTIWDLGVIASSDRPDRLERYLDAIMASAAFPIAFPPAYITIETEAGTFTEMHVDGGVRESAFFFEYFSLAGVRQAFEEAGFSDDDFQQELYLLVNGMVMLGGSTTYRPIEGKVGPVIDATITSLMFKVAQSSAYRMWVLSMAHGADFHLSFIPPDYPLTSGSLEFIPSDQTALFEFGYEQAINGTAWFTQRAPETADEIIELIIQSTEDLEHHTQDWMLQPGKTE